MIDAFNLKLNEADLDETTQFERIAKKYQTTGSKIFGANIESISKILANNTNSNGYINATNLQSAIFPQVNCNYFISHSSNDKDFALKLAGYMQTHDCKDIFIDSALWGNMYDLEYEINKEYSIITNETTKNGSKLFSYDKVINVASNSSMILCTALVNMISKCKYFFFLNTVSSLDEKQNTHSPWIYLELFTAQKIIEKRKLTKKEGVTEDTKIIYNVKSIINNFKEISNINTLMSNINVPIH